MVSAILFENPKFEVFRNHFISGPQLPSVNCNKRSKISATLHGCNHGVGLTIAAWHHMKMMS